MIICNQTHAKQKQIFWEFRKPFAEFAGICSKARAVQRQSLLEMSADPPPERQNGENKSILNYGCFAKTRWLRGVWLDARFVLQTFSGACYAFCKCVAVKLIFSRKDVFPIRPIENKYISSRPSEKKNREKGDELSDIYLVVVCWRRSVLCSTVP